MVKLGRNLKALSLSVGLHYKLPEDHKTIIWAAKVKKCMQANLK